ncbi:hypothetical protein H6F88_02055 [Oculatella sp. FACHB-28]|uniref:hypothetical protein n=1 Tax=Oculatella sp. FACHB-28 TaxID=2692845 RepID=UPI0016827780|nr:hypothetical protein [Oculatella sp. FACHB-28]MBD2054818.1 hypothetical protein [Oculatella sp. FACHB-28]
MDRQLTTAEIVEVFLALDGTKARALLQEVEDLRRRAFQAGACGQIQTELALHLGNETPLLTFLHMQASRTPTLGRNCEFILDE